jgi:transaldolase
MSRLHDLHRLEGQSIWLDNLSRRYLRDGSLTGRIDQGVRGLTSNPTIFAKAIQGSSDYDEQFLDLIAEGHDPLGAYWELVISDIATACETFESLHRSSDGVDGFVSVEVAPSLARDTEGTIAAARDLHERLGHSNAMIKIPATKEGLPAVRMMISEGRSVNVTLIFGLERYAEVIDAYITGLEDLATDPAADLSSVSSVASFFISRVDTEVDRQLSDLGAESLCGTAALAQGRLAYAMFTDRFAGPRWERLAARGARPQRPLWASTGTKNPNYSDVVYVDGLIGPLTVNTLPEPTLDAFIDHGAVERTVDIDGARDRDTWAHLAAAGIDMAQVAEVLEREGLESFSASFDEVIAALTTKAHDLRDR